jgi:signal transduction histidine kinase
MKLRTQLLWLCLVPLVFPTFGTIGIVVHSTGTSRLQLPPEVWIILLLPVGCSILASVAVAVGFRRLDQAFTGLRTAHRRIASGDLEFPLVISGDTEVQELVESLTEMRRQLKTEKERKALLLMGLSHDFRTPIGLIKGYVEALQDEVGLGLDQEARKKFLSIIRQKTGQMERLVDRWLYLVRLEMGELEITFRNVRIGPFLTGLWQRFAEDASIGGHRFRYRVSLAEDLEVRMDVDLIERALENLFANSCKFSPSGGLITWEARLERKQILLVLEDQGPGLEPSEIPFLWEPFFRGKEHSGKQGFGLGLSIVRRILEGHGFQVRAENRTDGQGARFSIAVNLGEDVGSYFR